VTDGIKVPITESCSALIVDPISCLKKTENGFLLEYTLYKEMVNSLLYNNNSLINKITKRCGDGPSSFINKVDINSISL